MAGNQKGQLAIKAGSLTKLAPCQWCLISSLETRKWRTSLLDGNPSWTQDIS